MKITFFYLFFALFIDANICWAQNAKDTLLILYDGSYAPYCFTYNHKNNKKVARIIVDIWLLWSKKTGIPIKFIFYFEDLRKSIIKYYDIFKHIFGSNKDDFDSKMTIVNKYRSDAHAKEISKEEMDVFRLSIAFIEIKIEEFNN